MQLKGNLQGSTFKLIWIIYQPCPGVSDPGFARNPRMRLARDLRNPSPSPSVNFYTCRLTATWALSGRVLERHLLHKFKPGRVNGACGLRPADILRSALRCRRSMDTGPSIIAWAVDVRLAARITLPSLTGEHMQHSRSKSILLEQQPGCQAPRPSQHYGIIDAASS